MRKTDPKPEDRLEAFAPDVWRRIAEKGTHYECMAGERLHEQGEVDDRLIIMLSGKVSLNRDKDGVEIRSGLLRMRGDTLSNTGVHLHQPKKYSFVVDEPGTRVLVLERQAVMDLCRQEQPFLEFLFQDLSQRLVKAVDYMRRDRDLTAEDRVILRINERYLAYNDVNITQAELANFVGVSRGTVAKSLKRLEDQGIIERKYGGIKVKDGAKLAALVETFMN